MYSDLESFLLFSPRSPSSFPTLLPTHCPIPCAVLLHQHLFWIDADAIVVDFEVRLEDFLREAAGADLVIGEDHHVTCKFNAGVFLLRAVTGVRRH